MRPQDVGFGDTQLVLGKHSGRHALESRLAKLGYKLKPKELESVFVNFKQIADKKKEVFDDDIIAMVDTRLDDAPSAYQLSRLSVKTETKKNPQVSIELKIKGKIKAGEGTGSGPVDAAYKILDKILQKKTTLLDYQIHSVTMGKDAQGEVTVKIQAPDGQVIRGQGLSTDVIEASVRAYLDAINKMEFHRSQVSKKGRSAHGV